MKYNFYTEKSPKVSEIGFGAWQLGKSIQWSEMSDRDSLGLIHEAVNLGVNFFDTAPNYGLGASETLLGEGLKNFNRSDLIINTKFGHTNEGLTNYNSSYLRESIEGSLKRLKTDYLDSILMHNPPKEYYNGNKCDHYEILEKLKEEGKILSYGASIDTAVDMKVFMDTTNGEIIEAFFNIVHQGTRKAFDQAINQNVKIIAKVPLDSGWLSGKYNEESSFSGVRSRWSKSDIITRSKVIDKIKEIPRGDQTLAQMALSYCVSYDAVATVIPGNKNLEQLRGNINSCNYNLDKTTIVLLEELYDREIKNLKLPW